MVAQFPARQYPDPWRRTLSAEPGQPWRPMASDLPDSQMRGQYTRLGGATGSINWAQGKYKSRVLGAPDRRRALEHLQRARTPDPDTHYARILGTAKFRSLEVPEDARDLSFSM